MNRLAVVTITSSIWVDEYPNCDNCGDPCEKAGAHDATGKWQSGARVFSLTGSPDGIDAGSFCEECAERLAESWERDRRRDQENYEYDQYLERREREEHAS